MKQFLRDYFSFNTKERNGIMVLLTALVVLLMYKSYLSSQDSPQKDGQEFREVSVGEIHTDSAVAYYPAIRKGNSTPFKEPRAKPDYFYFDPNTLEKAGWLKLGLSEKQSAILLNYVGKGGKFREKEDLRKIYGLKPEQEQDLEPFVRIRADSSKKKLVQAGDKHDFQHTTVSAKIKVGEKLELNGADSMALLRLPGIGPAFAHRILAYRERIGGFANARQLMEVFGMEEDRFNALSEIAVADSNAIRKININVVTVDELKNHPYFRWKLANQIVNYRKVHGMFRAVSDLSKLEQIDATLLNKLTPYISF
jgi:competence protein ComEA